MGNEPTPLRAAIDTGAAIRQWLSESSRRSRGSLSAWRFPAPGADDYAPSPMRFIIRTLLTALALWATVGIIPGLTFEGEAWRWIVIALIFGVINSFLKPILAILSIPFILVTLGLFYLLLNAAMFWLVIWLSDSVLDLGIMTDGFWPVFWGAIVMSIFSVIINQLTDG